MASLHQDQCSPSGARAEFKLRFAMVRDWEVVVQKHEQNDVRLLLSSQYGRSTTFGGRRALTYSELATLPTSTRQKRVGLNVC